MEADGYREALEDILAYTGGRRLVTMKEAKSYLGLADDRTVRNRVPSGFVDGKIYAVTLARALCKEEKKGRRK